MRLILAIVVACFVAACGLNGQSSAERAFVNSKSAVRSIQAVLDAQVIMQGMDQARTSDQRVARDINHGAPEAAPSAVTR
ncbi:MAG TPA: hypothetical protein VME47_21005 [Acetobacteraceae bacterium]|nr:hypothetical protein [Acetobacteraceae bacterium]